METCFLERQLVGQMYESDTSSFGATSFFCLGAILGYFGLFWAILVSDLNGNMFFGKAVGWPNV